jgi:hypothetical protein
MRRLQLAALLAVLSLGLTAIAGGSVAVAAEPMTVSKQSLRGTCKALEAAATDLQQARATADQAGVDAVHARFARIARRQSNDVPRAVRTQLHLVNQTLEEVQESPTTVRAARMHIARLVHGLTGIMLACDSGGISVTIEY